MPRVHHVKKARKDNQVCKKGESYYWWKFRFGGKRFSLTYPKPSQLTNSSFLKEAYDLNERIESVKGDDSIQGECEDIAQEFRTLGEQAQDSLDNMPDHLQESSTSGMLLQERVEECERVADELENVDCDVDEDEIKDEALEQLEYDHPNEEVKDKVNKDNVVKPKFKEDYKFIFETKLEEKYQEILDEVQGIQYEGS